MEGFGIEKLSLILVIVLVLFGARRIPEIGASVGKGIREFKRGMSDVGRDAEADSATKRETGATAPAEQVVASKPEEPRRLLGR